MDSPSKMGIGIFAFLYDYYQRIERYKKAYLASGVMAGSIATLATVWILSQGMYLFGCSQLIGAYKISTNIHNDVSNLNAIANDIIENGNNAGLPPINEAAINDSVSYGIRLISMMRRLEENLVRAEIVHSPDSPSQKHYIFSLPNTDALQMQADALAVIKASMYLTQHYCRRYGKSWEDCARFISNQTLDGTILGASCDSINMINCKKTLPYRSIDGSCNNPQNPRWGSALTAYSRVLFPNYADGIQLMKRAERSRESLPSARAISTRLSDSAIESDESKTLSIMQWSEFISHDLAHTPVRKMVSTGQPISCCDPDGFALSPRYIHPDCAPIKIPEGDPVYGSHYIRCMNYVRSLPAISQECSFGPVQQMNQVSHYLDGSTIYGSTLSRSRDLRVFKDGKLLVVTRDNHDYLPSGDPSNCCHESESCYKAGDDRVNFVPSLAVMHTIWHREHNRIAKKLAQINPLWWDEILYQEARRIVIAEIQHITYNEWLPIILGKDYTISEGFGIGNYTYNAYDDPSVSNEAASAVLRFLNSLKQGTLSVLDDNSLHNETLQLSEHFYNPRVIETNDTFDGLLRGLARQPSNKMDQNLVPDMTQGFYQTNKNKPGLDAMSLDIQQGRDHGLPGYNYYRQYCNLPAAQNIFEDLKNYIPKETVNTLKDLYDHPNDIDLVVGGIAEIPANGSLLGPTFRCLLAEQFARTRSTDRYFYDSPNQPRPFTATQLAEIRRITLARIYCDNSNNVLRMQPNVFIRPQPGNEIGPCDDFQAIPSVDLYAWAEKAKAYR